MFDFLPSDLATQSPTRIWSMFKGRFWVVGSIKGWNRTGLKSILGCDMADDGVRLCRRWWDGRFRSHDVDLRFHDGGGSWRWICFFFWDIYLCYLVLWFEGLFVTVLFHFFTTTTLPSNDVDHRAPHVSSPLLCWTEQEREELDATTTPATSHLKRVPEKGFWAYRRWLILLRSSTEELRV